MPGGWEIENTRVQDWKASNGVLLAVLLAALAIGHVGCKPGDASSGNFLGYKIGARYPATESTLSLGTNPFDPCFVIIRAENPVKPDDIEVVGVYVTLKTHTIIAIEGWSEFASAEEATAFHSLYSAKLRVRYPTWTVATPHSLFGGQRLDFEDRLRLELLQYESDNGSEKRVRVQVKLEPINAAEEKWLAFARAEADEIQAGLGGAGTPERDGL